MGVVRMRFARWVRVDTSSLTSKTIKELFNLVKSLITESVGLTFAFASSVDGF